MDHTQDLARRNTRELQFEPLGVGERAFRAHEQMRQVVFRAGQHHVQVITLHAPQDLGPALRDLGSLALGHGVHAINHALGIGGTILGSCEMNLRTIG